MRLRALLALRHSLIVPLLVGARDRIEAIRIKLAEVESSLIPSGLHVCRLRLKSRMGEHVFFLGTTVLGSILNIGSESLNLSKGCTAVKPLQVKALA
mgnify:CR=1 FL=1